VQTVLERGASIETALSEASSSIGATFGVKAANAISNMRNCIESHVSSLVQAARASEERVHLLENQLKETRDQLLQLQHSVMVTNITQSQGGRRPMSASSRGSMESIPETEAAARLLQGQVDSQRMQVKELEGELRQVRQDLITARASVDNLTSELNVSKREAADSQALAASLKAMAAGNVDALSFATENAALKQEISRSQHTISRLMDQEVAHLKMISSLEHDQEANLRLIDELKGQIMTSLLKNREIALDAEACQSELRDKEQELRTLHNYIVSLEADQDSNGGGEFTFLAAEAERLKAESKRFVCTAAR
jgi:chromosome segregation ATPase